MSDPFEIPVGDPQEATVALGGGLIGSTPLDELGYLRNRCNSLEMQVGKLKKELAETNKAVSRQAHVNAGLSGRILRLNDLLRDAHELNARLIAGA